MTSRGSSSTRHGLREAVVADALPLIVRSRAFADGAALLALAEDVRLEGIVWSAFGRPYRVVNDPAIG